MNSQQYITKGSCHRCVDCNQQVQYNTYTPMQQAVPTQTPSTTTPSILQLGIDNTPKELAGIGLYDTLQNPTAYVPHYAPHIIYTNNPQKRSCNKKHCKKCCKK